MKTTTKTELPTFSDSRFLSAKEKVLILKAWRSFLRSHFKRTLFVKRLYTHLINHCSFIAHFNLNGFYQEYFLTGDQKKRFLGQFVTGLSTEYGYRHWLYGDYSDINNAMCQVAMEYSDELLSKATAEQRNADINLARALLAKHGIQGVREES